MLKPVMSTLAFVFVLSSVPTAFACPGDKGGDKKWTCPGDGKEKKVLCPDHKEKPKAFPYGG